MKIKIVVGSQSRLEISAVETACTTLGIEAEVDAVAVLDGCWATPWRFSEIAEYALAKARAAVWSHPHVHELGVGFQTGMVQRGDACWFLFDSVCLTDGKGTPLESWWSKRIGVPRVIARETKRRGLMSVAIGQVIADLHGSPPDDPHRFLTRGVSSREAYLAPALINVFGKLIKRRIIQQ